MTPEYKSKLKNKEVNNDKDVVRKELRMDVTYTENNAVLEAFMELVKGACFVAKWEQYEAVHPIVCLTGTALVSRQEFNRLYTLLCSGVDSIEHFQERTNFSYNLGTVRSVNLERW